MKRKLLKKAEIKRLKPLTDAEDDDVRRLADKQNIHYYQARALYEKRRGNTTLEGFISDTTTT